MTLDKTALAMVLSKLVAAKHELGFRCCYWAGRGPSLEISIALAGVGLEEEGHARIFERFIADEIGGPPVDRDMLVTWDHWPSHDDVGAYLDELWPEAMLRYFIQDIEVSASIQALTGSLLPRLAERARKMIQEEKFHEIFALDALTAIGSISADAQAILCAQLNSALSELQARQSLREDLRALAGAGILAIDAPGVHDERLARSIAGAKRLCEGARTVDIPGG